MTALLRGLRSTRPLRLLVAAVTLLVGSLVGAGAANAAPPGPCDIYGNGKTPCVAAHSTVRALYSSYDGPLYQVQRASDQSTRDIGVVAAGGVADARSQDSFCGRTSCTITRIYDQSPQHNDLTIEGPGTNGPQNSGVIANALPVTVGGHEAYGARFDGRMGYRDNRTSGVATNGRPEGMYMVTSGNHTNGKCCFDYGNTEVTNADTGNGHMDALNFGNLCWFTPCPGSGPWAQADMENGLFQSDIGTSRDPSNTGNHSPFVTALLKNNGQNRFALKDGNAQSGGLTTTFAGPTPTNPAGYSPMHQEGGIVLGTGGDNSNEATGSFFEGVMTAGMPSDAADDAVQANIVGAGYQQ